MLKSLHIENYVLIERLDLTFESGLSIITGETGSGKSVLMAAIALLLGQRADIKSLKKDSSKCYVEACFDTIRELKPFFEENDIDYDEDLCVIRRELYANGKSRAFVNDLPVQLNILKELTIHLLDIHSQHENLLLGKDAFQLQMLDAMAATKERLSAYRQTYQAYRRAECRYDEMERSLSKALEEKDYIHFQYEQLRSAALKSGEQEALEQEWESLSHAEEIKSSLMQIAALLSSDRGIIASLRTASTIAESLSAVSDGLRESKERMETAYIDLKDLSRDIERWSENTDVDPARMDYVRERLEQIYDLQKKHRVKTVEALLELQDDYAKRLQQIETGDEALKSAEEELRKAKQKAFEQAGLLTNARKSILPAMEKQLVEQLHSLGMPHAVFKVEISEKEMDDSGKDKVAFYFSANKNVPPQLLSQIASGGEISRLMLCLKAMAARTNPYSTLIFDEIDTGVSGEIAHKMGLIMQEIARQRQVICITHLPQIAAKGDRHYKVFKSDDGHQSLSSVKCLDKEGRIQEIAAMLSGSVLSRAAVENARHLMNSND